jgi:hypothetical protein
MPTLDDIKQRLKELGDTDTFGTKKEIRYLPEILASDEMFQGLTSGLMDGNTWLIALTDRRIIFLDKGMIYGLKQKEVPLEKINSIEQKTGIMFGEIAIWDGASRMEIKNVMKKTVKPFVAAVNSALTDRRAPSLSASPQPSVAEQLRELADLRDKGVLTDDEFAEQKRKLLDA